MHVYIEDADRGAIVHRGERCATRHARGNPLERRTLDVGAGFARKLGSSLGELCRECWPGLRR